MWLSLKVCAIIVTDVMNRRTFIQTSTGALAAPAARVIPLDGKLPARSFGKTGHRLPVLAMGAAAFIKR